MKKEMTASEMGKKGSRAVLKKYGKKQMREWGKLGGRPRKVATDKDITEEKVINSLDLTNPA